MGIAVGILGSRSLASRPGESTALEVSEPESPFPSQVPTPRLVAALRVYDEIMARQNFLEFEARARAGWELKTGTWNPREVVPALRAFGDGRYEEAIEQLASLRATHPYDPRIAAYLGIALFHNGDRSDRVEDLLVLGLADVLQGSFHSVVRIHLARLYLGRGKTDEALSLLAYSASIPDGAGQLSAEIFARVREALEDD